MGENCAQLTIARPRYIIPSTIICGKQSLTTPELMVIYEAMMFEKISTLQLQPTNMLLLSVGIFKQLLDTNLFICIFTDIC